MLKDYGVEEQARRRSHPGKHFVETVRLSKLFKLRRQDRHCEYIAYCYGISVFLNFTSLSFFEYDSPTSVDSIFSLPFAPVERQLVLNQEQSRQWRLKTHVEKSPLEQGMANIFDI